MKIERASRYKDKLDLIFKRAGQAQDWLAEISPEVFLEDDKTKLASYRHFRRLLKLVWI